MLTFIPVYFLTHLTAVAYALTSIAFTDDNTRDIGRGLTVSTVGEIYRHCFVCVVMSRLPIERLRVLGTRITALWVQSENLGLVNEEDMEEIILKSL